MTGIPSTAQQLMFQGQHVARCRRLFECEIGVDSTLSLMIRGRGGMSDESESDEPSPKRRWRRLSVAGSARAAGSASIGPLDAVFEDLSILRRCLHRIHRFSPGVGGRELRRGGDRCGSLGHWSLITTGTIDPSTLSASALQAACRAGRVDAIESMVSHYGMDVNERDAGGWSALHVAMLHGCEDVVRCLFTLGAHDVVTNDGVHASSLRPDLWRGVSGEVAAITDVWRIGRVAKTATQLAVMIAKGTNRPRTCAGAYALR